MEQQKNLQKIFSLQFHDVQRQNIIRPHEIKFDEKDFAPSINDDQLLDRIRGSILGLATGDALGAHVEFRPRAFLVANPVKEFQSGGTWGLEKGQFTDDTSMALCLANSLLVCEEFELYDQLLRYKWWYRYGYMSSTGHCFDIGAATRQSLQEFEKRQKQFAHDRHMNLEELDVFSNPDLLDEFEVKCSKEGVAGNGALMRLAPVPLFFFRNPILAVEYSGQSAEITHGDQKAIDACRYYAALIVAALNGVKKDDLLNEKFYEEHIQWFSEKPLHQDILKIAQGSYKKQGGYDEGIRGKGYVVDALEAALWAFWSDNNSFEAGAVAAVNLGDDTDTTAAIYGQLAGIVYGFKGIPSKWIEQIYAKKFLLFICDWIAFSGMNWSNKFNNSSALTNLVNTEPTKTNSSFSFPSMKSSSTTIIEKKTIDSTGQVGFIYDFITESFSQPDQIVIKWENKPFPSPIRTCFIKKGNENECENLLRLIGFDDHLRLSLLSNLIQPKGLASLIDYPFIIDEYTRIIFYSHKTSQDTIISLTNNRLQSSTHLINAVVRGVELLIILRLSSQSMDEIDRILNEFHRSPLTNINLLNNPVFKNILSTHLYSNLPDLNEHKTLYHIFYHVSTMIDAPEYNWPCSYLIQPISNSNPKQSLPIRFHAFSTTEDILMKLASVHKIYSTLFHDNINQNIRTELKDQLDEIDNRLNDLDRQFDREKQRVKQFLLQSFRDKSDVIFTEHELKTFNIDIDDFIFRLSDIKQKQDFISELQKYGFIYWNILRHHTNTYNDNFHTVQQKLIKEYPQTLFICSNDYLNLNHSSQLNQFLNQFKDSSQKQKIYLDFSYSTYELNEITVLPFINPISDQPRFTSTLSLNIRTSSRQIPRDKPMNVLLLGKSSVGKSTLINNFANFIKYDTYEQMHPTRSTLEVVVSFLFSLPNNDSQSETHFISIGNYHQNENLVHLNRSTTQNCKSYSFSLKDQKQKINLIDTPGFGKSDNPKDDDVSMQHILSRITNLTHLDAICIVIQSNETNLQCYATCLNSLFNCFGQQIQNNIIFIFNKALSYPTDQNIKLSQIHKLVERFKNQNIHFNEKQILELDNTYFKQFSVWSYLRHFNEQECKRSWQISQNGWNQFLTHITKYVQPFVIDQGLERKKFYFIEIHRLIRPILETLRHTLRNIILTNNRYNCSIEFIPTANNRPSAICYSCMKRTWNRYGPFWIIEDYQHEFHENCNSCCCQTSQHFQTDYTIQYRFLPNQSNRTDQLINFSFDEYLSLILQLSYFIFSEKQYDPFLPYFEFMIEQERYLSTSVDTNSINRILHHDLVVLKQNYQRKLSLRIQEKPLDYSLNIDGIIDRFKEIPLIDKQLQMSNLFKD